METVTVTNQKGGVGKTTTAHILSTGLAMQGFKVLAVDIDPQTNLTFTAGLDPLEAPVTLYELLKKTAKTTLQAAQRTAAGFYMIPGSLDLAGADMEFTQTGREYLLKEALEPLEESFDFCIIDTPPTLGILTVNALTASQKVIVPMGADVYSLQGLSQLQGLINNVKKYSNPALSIDGLLVTKYSPRAIINRQIKDSFEDVAKRLKTKVYKTSIREAVAVKEIQFLQGNIFTDYPKANVTEDYRGFIEEFLKGEGKK